MADHSAIDHTGLPGISSVNAGTSFPGSPATGDRFYRSDRSIDYFYDGTRWLTVNEYAIAAAGETVQPTAGGNSIASMPIDNGFDAYVTRVELALYVNGTNDGSNYWTVTANKVSSSNANTSLGSASTSANSGATWLSKSIGVNAVVARSGFLLVRLNAGVSGSPGSLYFSSKILYRLVG